jgi:hypothetical protein
MTADVAITTEEMAPIEALLAPGAAPFLALRTHTQQAGHDAVRGHKAGAAPARLVEGANILAAHGYT